MVTFIVFLLSIPLVLAGCPCNEQIFEEKFEEKSVNQGSLFNISLPKMPNVTIRLNQTKIGNFTDIMDYVPILVVEKINSLYTLFINWLKGTMKETLKYFVVELIDFLFQFEVNVTENKTVS